MQSEITPTREKIISHHNAWLGVAHAIAQHCSCLAKLMEISTPMCCRQVLEAGHISMNLANKTKNRVARQGSRAVRRCTQVCI